MKAKRYLTKSRFKLACECPAKLFYTKKTEYADQKQVDSFLESLAEGGFQVGELAKSYFPGGHDITTLDHEEAVRQTDELLKENNVIIYEAAICTGNLFIRADILIKNGNDLELIEVKAKSFEPSDQNQFFNKNGSIKSEWQEYLYDVAFQKYVVNQALPEYNLKAYLMLADKSAKCPTDGLNQKFRITKDKTGRKKVLVSDKLNDADLNPPILYKANVEQLCELILNQTECIENIKLFSKHYALDEKINAPVSKACEKCEFQTRPSDEKNGLKSGKKECWQENLGWTDADFEEPTIFDIWKFGKKQDLIADGRIKMSQVVEEDIRPKSNDQPGISSSQRQWLQVQKVQANDKSAWLDRENLAREMASWKFPLHFIDFETSMVAIPFNQGRRPYENIAFQFSHHVVYQDGTIEHAGEYINTTPGAFPNYEFVRQLKAELGHDSGSIFRYAAHENTILNAIYRQLQTDQSEIEDRAELLEFIQSITQSKNGKQTWVGPRNMIDMLEIVKRFYYDPATNGSNSIKQVLPAILNSSDYLKDKYSKPIYGAENGIKSLNFEDWQWIKYDCDKVIDPYLLLPKMFLDASDKELILLSDENELKDGGAAMTAYARMQFTEISSYEAEQIRKALLRYCELDTLAMVMIYEGWRELVNVR
jgi:hypothetical protein